MPHPYPARARGPSLCGNAQKVETTRGCSGAKRARSFAATLAHRSLASRRLAPQNAAQVGVLRAYGTERVRQRQPSGLPAPSACDSDYMKAQRRTAPRSNPRS